MENKKAWIIGGIVVVVIVLAVAGMMGAGDGPGGFEGVQEVLKDAG